LWDFCANDKSQQTIEKSSVFVEQEPPSGTVRAEKQWQRRERVAFKTSTAAVYAEVRRGIKRKLSLLASLDVQAQKLI
jgi:hypothetical protein